MTLYVYINPSKTGMQPTTKWNVIKQFYKIVTKGQLSATFLAIVDHFRVTQ